MLADRLGDARESAGRALSLAREGGHRPSEAWALRLLGEATARDPGDDAEGYYRKALALAEELGMRPLVAHCHVGLGLYRSTQKPALAEEHIVAATSMYGDMGMASWLEKARGSLRA